MDMPDERALVSNSAMVYLVLAGTVLLVLLAATGVGVQLAHGLWIGIWAERHHHHHESNGSRG